MNNFFRKIRQNLLSAGKVGKYFSYAIGEIFLVVIGILIALQINNWNQNRLERQEEKIILQNLKDDYNNAIEEFEILNGIRNETISAAKDIFKLSSSIVDDYSTTYLDSLFSKTLSSPTYNNKTGSLEVLLTSGKINLISNQKLKELLIEWPGDVEDMIEDEITHSNMLQGRYSDLVETYLSWNDLVMAYSYDRARFNNIAFESMPNNKIVVSDYAAILNNMTFLNILNRRASFCMISNQETKVLIEKAKVIIDLIDEELNQWLIELRLGPWSAKILKSFYYFHQAMTYLPVDQSVVNMNNQDSEWLNSLEKLDKL